MMYDNFFNEFFRELAAPSWNRCFKEKDGYKIVPEKNEKGEIIGCVVAFNTLGVDAKNIKVKHLTNMNETDIRVSGTSNIPELKSNYTCNYELCLTDMDVDDEDIQYKVKNGFTFVYIKLKNSVKVEKKELDAKKIEDGEAFDW